MLKKSLILSLLFLSSPVYATDIVHQFKSPSFSGVNTSAHWLTIENQEATRRKAIQDKIESDLKAAIQAEQNSILNKFMNNLQSRIYSQLAKQLTDNLFGPNAQDTGSFELDGNSVAFEKNLDGITLTITQPDGTSTSITIPTTGSFKF
jgi:curli production assembly/transport component CsgF